MTLTTSLTNLLVIKEVVINNYLSAVPKKDDDWNDLLGFLPNEWEEKCSELGALIRTRKFPNANTLLRTLLIHLLDGCSLRETSVYSKLSGLVDVSDVAILKRLHSSGEWFQWLCTSLCKRWLPHQTLNETLLKNNQIVLLDATHVSEPGSTGTDWRIHYSFCLNTLGCLSVEVTDSSIGESFKYYPLTKGAIYIGDRGYYHLSGIEHVVTNEADVIVRMNSQARNFSKEESDKPFNILDALRTIKASRIGDWKVTYKGKTGLITGRICAIRKNKYAREKSIKKVRDTFARKQMKVSKSSLLAAEYVFVFTTLPTDSITAKEVLELYRGRWQIELVFKRLKSIIGLGHLPKQDPVGAKAWLQGKLFCAFLIESLIQVAEHFSPWGYEWKAEKEMA